MADKNPHIKKTTERTIVWIVATIVHLIVLVFLARIIIIEMPKRKEAFMTEVKKLMEKKKPPPKAKKEEKFLTEIPAHIMKKIVLPEEQLRTRGQVKGPVQLAPLTAVKRDTAIGARRMLPSAGEILGFQRRARRKARIKFLKRFKVFGTGRAVEAIFTPTIAVYDAGDWNANPAAMPNLMTEVKRKTKVKANTDPRKIKADSKDLYDSPFIFITGSKDFRFSEEEVKNLRDYILQGGSIWADNGRPGRRSLFDIAFKRELKRILPDREFQQIDCNHPVFKSFFQFIRVPEGMNWRDDPIEIVDIDGRAVVIYTLNAYGDLWETAFTKDGRVDTELDENWSHRWGPHWARTNTSWGESNWHLPVQDYKNINQESIDKAYRLGVNIVVYFLTAG